MLMISVFVPILRAGQISSRDTITASKAFASMPMDYLDLLDPSARLDMLDYFAADSVWQAPNNMNGRSWLEAVTPVYLKVRLTDVSYYQLRVLQSKKGDIVVASYTIDGEDGADDSSLFFFDSRMTPLDPDRYFRQPHVREFISFTKDCGLSPKEIDSIVPFPTVKYTLDPDSPVLVARLTVGEYMSKEQYDRIKPFIKSELIYDWDGKKFRLRK